VAVKKMREPFREGVRAKRAYRRQKKKGVVPKEAHKTARKSNSGRRGIFT